MRMLGRSSAFRQLSKLIDRYACCDACVLIEGETGTGKELAARGIHYSSARAAGPFVPVNCGAIPDTLVESELFGHKRGAYTDARSDEMGMVAASDGGTLLLDEVDTLSLKAQVALLRFLQDHEYYKVGSRVPQRANVRVIAATNTDLKALVRAQRFRMDLYYRLGVLTLHVPPLRERDTDVLELADQFLHSAPAQRGCLRSFDPATRALLLEHSWPGNIRELENVICRAALLSEGSSVSISRTDLALSDHSPPIALDAPDGGMNFCAARRDALSRFERRFVCRLLLETRGNVTHAANLSGKERRSFGKLIKKHGIDPLGFR